MCLGSTDLPLAVLGRLQAAAAGAALRDARPAVFCSRLSRSRQTAQWIGGPVLALPGLEELDAGDWDGLFFEEIRARWPALYALRGEDPSVSPPGAESRESGLARFLPALDRALETCPGDVAVVSHASVMQTFLCFAAGLSTDRARTISLPYGSVTRLTWEEGRFTPQEIGALPHPAPDAGFCARLLEAAGTPPAVADHCAAVARQALALSRALESAGAPLDEGLVFAGAMLHDIARTQKDHAAAGAAWLAELGYPDIAGVIRQHHDPEDPGRIDEAAAVFLADKLTEGSVRTSLGARFGKSREKCGSPEALAAHERRYRAALETAARINAICGKELIR